MLRQRDRTVSIGVVRGFLRSTFLRSAIRNANFPSYRNNDSGFRVCFQQIQM